jgi:hypothetical protein
MDGTKCVRVITETLDLSSDRQDLESKANFEILGMNAISQTSKLARKGDFK